MSTQREKSNFEYNSSVIANLLGISDVALLENPYEAIVEHADTLGLGFLIEDNDENKANSLGVFPSNRLHAPGYLSWYKLVGLFPRPTDYSYGHAWQKHSRLADFYNDHTWLVAFPTHQNRNGSIGIIHEVVPLLPLPMPVEEVEAQSP